MTAPAPRERAGWRSQWLIHAVLAIAAAAAEPALEGPEVTKLDWNVRALRAADFNGDGRQDLALLNNDRSTVVLLLQNEPGATAEPERSLRSNRWEPVVENARFRKEPITAGITLYDLAVGDLNGDGRVDLVHTGAPHALTVRYRTGDDGWREHRVTPAPEPTQAGASLIVADLDDDEHNDLVMLGQTELAVYRQTGDGTLSPPERFPLPDENCAGLELADFNQDGRPDLLYVHGRDPRGSLRVRLQTAGRSFGPELAFPLDRIISRIRPVTLAGADASAFAFVAGPVGQVQVVTFGDAEQPETERRLPRPRMFRPRLSGRSPAAYALGDFDGDGRRDVAASDADGAQLSVYFRQRGGDFTEAEVYPSLSEVQSLAATDWNGDGRDELFLASAKERTVAWAAVGGDRRMEFPEPLALPGKPLALAATRLDGIPVLAVALEDDAKQTVMLLAPGEAGPAPRVVQTVVLPKLRTSLSALRWWDANQDGRPDLALFVPRDAMRVLVQDADGTFRDVTSTNGYRRGLVDNVEPSAVTLADVDGDAKDELVVAMRGFARALRLSQADALEVVAQFNARTATAELTTTLHLPRAGAPRRDVVLYDRRGEELSRLQPDAGGVYRIVKTESADRIEVVGAWSGEEECFVFGADRFWWLPLGRRDYEVETVSAHVTDLPGVRYAEVVPADLDADGRSELVALDPERHVVELLVQAEAPADWRSWLHFVVFEVDPHLQQNPRGNYEPREALVADVTGDDRPDLILLVHDRVLVYPQK